MHKRANLELQDAMPDVRLMITDASKSCVSNDNIGAAYGARTYHIPSGLRAFRIVGFIQNLLHPIAMSQFISAIWSKVQGFDLNDFKAQSLVERHPDRGALQPGDGQVSLFCEGESVSYQSTTVTIALVPR